MALFNKLFTGRRGTQNKHLDNVSDKLFAFSKDQVRVVLFRECDFRGRKLLFDSNSIKKIPVSQEKSTIPKNESEEGEKFAEVSDGFGYIYTKPQPDVCQLSEMVFGSVAMSFRGTYFKMHNLDTPNRLMFTQVFPSPRYSNQSRASTSSRSYPHTSNQSLEHSNKLNDSGASSTNSISEQLSVHSTTSDTILVCRERQSTPLNVPNTNNFSTSHSSLVGDSGYSADHSYISSEPPSLSTWNSIYEGSGSSLSFSSNSLFKRWLRKTSTSLENSVQSLSSAMSTNEYSGKHHHRSSKLGLTFLIQLTCDQEEALTQFFMEHITFIEAMLWRARKIVEMAFTKSQNFASLMVNMASFSTQYLVSLLSGSYLSMNLWLSLTNGCDNCNSISAFSATVSDNNKTSCMFRSASSDLLDAKKRQFDSSSDISGDFTYSLNGLTSKQSDTAVTLFNISKYLKSEWDPFHLKKSLLKEQDIAAERFVRDFCELLEIIDVKDTNFFMSTLITAVLTNHLGWVNTCLPPTTGENTILVHKSPFNPLWGELSDLYGAIGHPTKMAQTIVTGTNRKDIISKILMSLTYFIRCCDVERRTPIRSNIQSENKAVEIICQNYSCIPKENFKKYEDHLRELLNSTGSEFSDAQKKSETKNLISEKGNFLKGMVKTRTCLASLVDMEETCKPYSNNNDEVSGSVYSNFNLEGQIYSSLNGCCTSNENSYLSNEEITNKVLKLCRVPSNISAINEITRCRKTSMEKQMKCDDSVEAKRDVVFVLGDNDQLVGLKKEEKVDLRNIPDKEVTAATRPSFLDLSKENEFKDANFKKNDDILVKPSTSWSSVENHGEIIPKPEAESTIVRLSKYSRSQSMPPEDRKVEENKSKIKSKYRYSGVKFNLQQYPQILSNYMKSKNLEMSNLQFGDKGLKFDELSSISDCVNSKYPEVDGDYEETEALQTPSNASELEFTSDLFIAPTTPQQAKESNTTDTQLNSTFIKQQVPNTIVVTDGEDKKPNKVDMAERKLSSSSRCKMKVVNFPMPKSTYSTPATKTVKYTTSLMRAANNTYIPDMVLQGSTLPKQEWESQLKNDLILASQHSLIDQAVEESVAVIANTDTWEVQLMSSHMFVFDKSSTGIRVGMSQLVANMLESLLQMWKLNVPPLYCLMHVEQTLQELFIQSKALAELLLASEFCSMEQLTSTLQLEVNDVPLLLAVASTHSPQVTHKYGLSFQ